MGEVVMVIGKSGSGKSTALRNFKDGECLVLNVLGKRMPFKGHLPSVRMPKYDTCKAALKDNSYNTYIIDDSTYLMQLENFDRAREKGYEKFTEMAQSFEQLILSALADTDDSTITYFLHHPMFDDDGNMVPMSAGKMLQEKFMVEGAFPIVIESLVKDGEHKFMTQNDGTSIAKTPMGMFDEKYIDNDLELVDRTIREYWELGPRRMVK